MRRRVTGNSLDSTTEQSVVIATGPSPRGGGGVDDGMFTPRRAPYSKRSLDLRHQRHTSFVSPALHMPTDTLASKN